MVSLLSDERSYFESGVLLEAERLCCSASSALWPGSLPGPSPGPAPAWSGSAGTCRRCWASGRGGSGALPSGTQRPAGLDSGQALPCAPGLDNWGVCLRPQALGFSPGIWILSCFSSLSHSSGNCMITCYFLASITVQSYCQTSGSPRLSRNPGAG